jgi:outer membrane protein/protease secretion system outer membrane protein
MSGATTDWALRRDFACTGIRGVSRGVLRVKTLEQAVRSADKWPFRTGARSFQTRARTLVDTLNTEQQKASARDLVQARFVYLLSVYGYKALAGPKPGD